MFCEKCGKELPADARFCEHCGNPVTMEESLLDRAKRQDQAALAEIYEQTSGAVYRVLKVLIKNDEDTVQDLLQDTYVKAFTRLDQLQDESKLLPWLKTIANNSAKDWLKKCKPVLFTAMAGNEGNEETEALSFEENIEADRIDENPELAMDEKEVRRLVMEILNQLPEDQRVVLGMFYYEDMSVKEIASILEVSDNTVKSRLNYGRKKVKAPNCTMLHRLLSLYICCTDLENLHLWKQPSWIPCRLRCTQHCSALQHRRYIRMQDTPFIIMQRIGLLRQLHIQHLQGLAVERQRQHQRYIMHHRQLRQHQKLRELPRALQPDMQG